MARAEAKLKELRFESVVDYAPETQAECEVYFTYKREIKKKHQPVDRLFHQPRWQHQHLNTV